MDGGRTAAAFSADIMVVFRGPLPHHSGICRSFPRWCGKRRRSVCSGRGSMTSPPSSTPSARSTSEHLHHVLSTRITTLSWMILMMIVMKSTISRSHNPPREAQVRMVDCYDYLF
jgi:hypothetical protein